jgi:hypothetical protein
MGRASGACGVVSGQADHFHSVAELLAFIARVLSEGGMEGEDR